MSRIDRMDAPEEIELTLANVNEWSAYQQLLNEGKIVADVAGRLRYPHGAPVGRLVRVRTNKDGSPVYKESATEWFDPGSETARNFVWPE